MMRMFAVPHHAARAAAELAQARLDKLNADSCAEHWKHTSRMLEERIARLERIAADAPAAKKSGFLRWGFL